MSNGNDLRAMGIELDWTEEESRTISPLSCIVVAKGIDNEGDTVYAFICSKGMTNVEAAGYVRFADQHVNMRLQYDILSATVLDEEPPDYDTFVTS
jgi:hypothetical protein